MHQTRPDKDCAASFVWPSSSSSRFACLIDLLKAISVAAAAAAEDDDDDEVARVLHVRAHVQFLTLFYVSLWAKL